MTTILLITITCLVIWIIYLNYKIHVTQKNIQLLRYWLDSIDENELNHSIHDKRYFIEALKIMDNLYYLEKQEDDEEE